MVIVVAGMEGALPSVVAGLVSRPVIAVPTSVGYGANFGGLAALLGMLNSCGSGVTVVNIDNGFGAGYAASQINALAAQDGMKTLYLDIFSGISGDMFMGALLDLGVDPTSWSRIGEAAAVTGYHLHATRGRRRGIAGVKFDVHLDSAHHHHHSHTRRVASARACMPATSIYQTTHTLTARNFSRDPAIDCRRAGSRNG